jgi:hypothetical protein
MHCQASLHSQGAALDGAKPIQRLPAGKRTKGKKRGPKTAWQNRAAYNRARCIERLKPVQVENLCAADRFASLNGTGLNGWLTVRFVSGDIALAEFQIGAKRLGQWFRRNGGELIWIYAWEAIGGNHVHILLHIPKSIWQVAREAIVAAFDSHDVLLKRRTRGPDAMTYLCKGTDWVTHKRLGRNSRIRVKLKQGAISWKRCGTSEGLGSKARRLVGFDG